MTEHVCPRRAESMHEMHPEWDKKDTWGNGGCSHCGSLHPDEFMRLAEAGTELGPTDKDYKVYVGASGKFYFQHLSEDQMKSFIESLNAGKYKLGAPGRFYRLPFFIVGKP